MCASDGVTSSNRCFFNNRQCHDPSLTVAHEGECKKGNLHCISKYAKFSPYFLLYTYDIECISRILFFLEPANCAKLGQRCKKGATTGKRKCCPGLRCKGRRPTRCVKAGGGGKPCKPKNSPCVKASACCSKRCNKKKCA